MASTSYSAAVALPGRYTPEVLSSVALPLQPVNAGAAAATAAAAAAASSSSSSTASSTSPTYKHALLSQAINPCMDLVALLSRDVNVSHGGASGSPATASDPNAGLPPPPPGMSAARSQALMRMRMAARAKALAAAGIKPTEGAAGALASTSAPSPKLTRCASLRLSLWRMASVAGERGTRVWDVTVNAPDRFGDVAGDVSEMEDQRVDGLAWSPDGLVLALGITLSRRQTPSHAGGARVQRYVCLYALQDGQQVRQVPLPNGSTETEPALLGMTWTSLQTTERPVRPGSVDHMLSLLGPLPAIEQAREDQEGKARQRQRMFQAMRDPNRAKAEADKKAREVAAAEPRSALGIAITEYPRGLVHGEETGLSRSKTSSQRTMTDAMQSTTAGVLCAWSAKEVHLFLDGAIYLGSVKSHVPDSIAAARIDSRSGRVCLVGTGSTDAAPAVHFGRLASHLHPLTPAFDSLTHLRALSTHSYDLLLYCYDAVVSMRTTYRTMHGDCIAAWNRRARQTAKRYATHLPSEVLMLLATGFANDTMLSVLLGSDTFSENDLNKMRTDVLSGLGALETAAGRLLSALQRLLLVFEELRGCRLWEERYGLFFDGNDPIDVVLRTLSTMAEQAIRLARTANQEHAVWTHYYRWWLFERVRQEALRDNKAPADALAAAGGDVTYNVVMLAEFLRRGYENASLEGMLGIEMDAKTRGEEVEDDDEDVDDADERRRRTEIANKAQASMPPIAAANTADARPGEPLSNGSARSADLQPWYTDTALQSRIAHAIKVLERPPTLEKSFIAVGKTPPKPDDMACVANRHSLHVVPAHGLARRVAQHDSVGRSTASLKQMTSDTILLVAPWFKEAFSRWTEQVDSDAESAEQILDLPGASIASGQADSIESLAGGPTAHAVESKLVRTYVDTARGEHCTAVVFVQDDCWHVTVVTTPLQSQPSTHSPKVTRVKLDSVANVLDAHFWSADEVVLLVRTPDDNATILASIRLDESLSARAHRSVIIDTRSGGGGAKKLALNRKKDVCATLDDEGRLVYWDMVLQTTGDEEESTEWSRGIVIEPDDEML